MPFVGALGDETKDSGEEAMSIVNMDMEILEEAEKQYKVREDLAKEDWHYVYRHNSGLNGNDKKASGGEKGRVRREGYL